MSAVFLSMLMMVGLYGVLGTSPMNCDGCDPGNCLVVDCPCGSYKDECNCCDRCLKCRNEECNYFAGDRCLGYLKCAPPDGMTILETMMAGRNGICAITSDIWSVANDDDYIYDEEDDFDANDDEEVNNNIQE